MRDSRFVILHQEVYTIKAFAQNFGIGRSKIYEEIKAGRLLIRKAGTRTLITHDDAMSWLKNLPEGVHQTKYM